MGALTHAAWLLLAMAALGQVRPAEAQGARGGPAVPDDALSVRSPLLRAEQEGPAPDTLRNVEAEPRLIAPGVHPSGEVDLADRMPALALCGGVLRPVRLRVTSGPELTEVRAPCEARVILTGVPLRKGHRPRAAAVRVQGETRTSPQGPLQLSVQLGQRRYKVERVRLGSSGYRVVLEGGGEPVTLYECQSTDEAQWALMWAGDLDRDGKLDLLIDAADAFDLSEVRLFLSRGAEQAVDEAAMLRTKLTPATP